LGSDQDKPAAFMALLQPLQRQLEVYCRRVFRDGSQAEDVIQTAVMTAFSQFDRYTAGTNFRAWMFRFVTNEASNRNRRRALASWGELPSEPAAGPDEFPATDDLVAMLTEWPCVVREHLDQLVADALDGLPARERTVLLLRAVGQLSYQEIGEVLGIPINSVMGYLSRARRKLRQSLAGYAAERGIHGRSTTGEMPP
jgi:RNA polymerase sigma-70 factor (ECF subfamily)